MRGIATQCCEQPLPEQWIEIVGARVPAVCTVYALAAPEQRSSGYSRAPVVVVLVVVVVAVLLLCLNSGCACSMRLYGSTTFACVSHPSPPQDEFQYCYSHEKQQHVQNDTVTLHKRYANDYKVSRCTRPCIQGV